MTARQTEKADQTELTPPSPPPPVQKSSSPVFAKVSGYLSKQLTAPVNIVSNGSKGVIEISYQNKDDLIRIIELLGIDTNKKLIK